jgi:ubiquinone/menaquinone biosynthesis C-methylase UbiE
MSDLKQLQQDWNDLAELDPLWAIASEPDKVFNKWDIEEFFETGSAYVQEALAIVQESGITLKKETVLDFGCGVGRFTQILAEEFETCYGVDISPKMIELANHFNRYGDRCNYILNSKSDLSIFGDDFFDFIYTAEVLQHLPIELTKTYLVEFIRILKKNSTLVFQIPVQSLALYEKKLFLKKLPKYHTRRIFNKLQGILVGHDSTSRYYRLRQIRVSKQWLYNKYGFHPQIEMNSLGEVEIVELIEELGAKVVNVVDKKHPEMVNKLFVVTKL